MPLPSATSACAVSSRLCLVTSTSYSSRERRVPDLHRGRVAVVAEDVQASRCRAGSAGRRRPEGQSSAPPARERRGRARTARRCPAPRERGRSRDRRARRSASGVSPPGQPSRKIIQPGRCRVDLLRREPLVLAVAPLRRDRARPPRDPPSPASSQVSRARLQRAGEHEREGLVGQHRAQAPRYRAPVLGQRDVGHAGVLPAQAPFGLAVTDQVDLLAMPWSDSLRSPRRCRDGRALAPLAAPAPVRISGMSSPCSAMYCLCSISLSRIACLA